MQPTNARIIHEINRTGGTQQENIIAGIMTRIGLAHSSTFLPFRATVSWSNGSCVRQDVGKRASRLGIGLLNAEEAPRLRQQVGNALA